MPDVTLPNLTPPSLSSTKSALAQLRNFSLVGSSSQTKSEPAASDDLLRKGVRVTNDVS